MIAVRLIRYALVTQITSQSQKYRQSRKVLSKSYIVVMERRPKPAPCFYIPYRISTGPLQWQCGHLFRADLEDIEKYEHHCFPKPLGDNVQRKNTRTRGAKDRKTEGESIIKEENVLVVDLAGGQTPCLDNPVLCLVDVLFRVDVPDTDTDPVLGEDDVSSFHSLRGDVLDLDNGDIDLPADPGDTAEDDESDDEREELAAGGRFG